jgi:hypothetical protein
MRLLATGVGICMATFGLQACIVKDTTHRLYLSPEGAVAWTVLEQDVRSDHSEPWQRSSEESAFIEAVIEKRHPMEIGLKQLASDATSVRWIRSERPYAVLTEARFARVDRLIQSFCDALKIDAQVSLESTADGSQLSVVLALSSLEQEGTEEETPVAFLLEDLDHYRFVLTEGRFVSADGFKLLENGSQAMLKIAERAEQYDARRLELRLEWTNR